MINEKTATEIPTAKLLPAIITAELAALAARREEAGAAWDAQICRHAMAMIAPPAPLELSNPASLDPSKGLGGRRRGRKPRGETPASVADLNGGGK